MKRTITSAAIILIAAVVSGCGAKDASKDYEACFNGAIGSPPKETMDTNQKIEACMDKSGYGKKDPNGSTRVVANWVKK